MSTKALKRITLTPIQKELLKEIFIQEFSNQSGINKTQFRATHLEKRDEINILEKNELIRAEGTFGDEEYRITSLSLYKISHPKAQALLKDIEHIFSFIHSKYRNNVKIVITYKDISNALKLDLERISLIMYFMEKSHIIYRRKNAYLDCTEVNINEKILEHADFMSLLNSDEQYILNGNKLLRGTMPLYLKGLDGTKPLLPINNHKKTIINWPSCTSNAFLDLLNEIAVAYTDRLPALCAMGLRTVFDLVANDKVKESTFNKNLDSLFQSGYINSNQKEVLRSALEVGHAAAHRGYIPSMEDIDEVKDIMYHLLVSVYGNNAKRKLDKNTPPRTKNEPKNQ